MTNKELIDIAQETCNFIKLREEFTAGEVGAAILAESGEVYTGVCIDLDCGLGFCAEAAAIAEMLKNGETRIIKIVATLETGEIMTPCGRCREMIIQLNKKNTETLIVLNEDEEAELHELLPLHWLDKLDNK